MSRASTIARGVMVQTVARFAGLPLSLLTTAALTRYLGVEGYGVLATAIIFVGLFDTFSELGIGRVIIQRAAAGKGQTARDLSASWVFSCFYSIPLALVCGSSAVLVYPGDSQRQLACWIVATGLLWRVLSTAFDPVFDIAIEYRAIAAGDFSGRAAALGLALITVNKDLGLPAAAVTLTLPNFCRFLVSATAVLRGAQIAWVCDFHLIRRLLRDSVPFTCMIAVAVLYWNADGFLLSVLSSNAEVGAYGLSLQIAFALTAVVSIFERSVLSTLSESYQVDKLRFVRAISLGYKFLLLAAIPIAGFGWLVSTEIVRLVASDTFVGPAAPVLPLFFVAISFMFLTANGSDALIAAGDQRFLTKISVFNLLLNISMNLTLIPHFGAVGAGLSLIASELSGTLLSQVRLHRRHAPSSFPWRHAVKLLVATVLGVLSYFLLQPLGLWISLAGTIVSYGVFAIVFGCIPQEMKTALRQVVVKSK